MPIVRDPLNPKLSLWHWLAFQLRYLRELNGLSLTQCGQIINAARSTVSNIEAGRQRIDDDQAAKLDVRYGTGQLLQLLLYYARIGHDPEWFKQYSQYESLATIIRIYNGQVIPGPFQTEAYIRALLSERGSHDIEARIAVRLARQEAILNRSNPAFIWVLLDQGVLEIEAGGRAVMRAQLQHLLSMTTLDNVSVRIIAKSAGVHLGQDGPMRIISLDSRDIAYAGARRGGRLIEAPAEVRELGIDFDRIGQKAESEEASRTLIKQVMESMHDD